MDPILILLGVFLIGAVIWVITSMGFVQNANKEDEPSLEGRLTVQDLADSVREKGGFEVYVQSRGRPELNDRMPPGSDKDIVYVRANHKIISPGNIADIVPLSIGGKIGKAKAFPGITDFDVIASGPLVYDTADRVKGVARLRRGPKHKLHTYHFSMDDVLGTSSQEEAYFVEFTLRAYLPDDHQRSAFARLIIVGEENLIKDVVQYVKEHPADYLRFAKELVPQDQFPNVNKGILDKTPLGDEIVFLDTANMDKKINVHLNSDGDPIISYGISDNSSNLIEHVYAQYGEHVKVPKASKDRFSITKYK